MMPGPLTTVPNAGLPVGFRKRTSPHGDEKLSAAGILFVTPDRRALFVKRAPGSDHAGEWALPAGRVEQDEEPADAARREALEEIGHLAAWDLAPIHRETSDEGIDFSTFGQNVEDAFDPILNEEHNEHVWAPLSAPPKPLHPGVDKLLKQFFAEEAKEPAHKKSGSASGLEQQFEFDEDFEFEHWNDPAFELERGNTFDIATDSSLRLALDGESVRSFDDDGRMRVEVANISKSNICPYRGDEIPGWEDLKLDPEKIYQMLRDPDELAKSVKTWNGVQILSKHVPVDIEDHREQDIVGTTGTDASFEFPYLRNSLIFWSKEGLDLIDSGKQKELSCGYHYTPEMTAGFFDGKPFDGIMRDIRGNHVALVEEGRAGPDVVVGDSALNEHDRTSSRVQKEHPMTTKRPTRLEYLAVMNTARALNPLLAMDQKVEYGPIFKGLDSKNFKSRKAKLVSDVKVALKGKTIAKDASVEHLASLLDHLEHVTEPKSLDESVSGPQHRAMEAAAHGHSTLGIPKGVGSEFSDADKGKKFADALPEVLRKGGMNDDDIKHVMDNWPMKVGEMDETPENALDHEAEDEDDMNEDTEIEEEEAEDETESEEEEEKKMSAKDKAAKDKAAKDKAAKDKAKAKDKAEGAMDQKNLITMDQAEKMVQSALAADRKRTNETVTAREAVRPKVGDLPMALDSAEAVYRAAAAALGLEGLEEVNLAGLRVLVDRQPNAGARVNDNVRPLRIAQDSAEASDFANEMTKRIGLA
jgi:uncharacterized protein